MAGWTLPNVAPALTSGTYTATAEVTTDAGPQASSPVTFYVQAGSVVEPPPPDTTPPPQVTGTNLVRFGTGQLVLGWDASPAADLDHYEVWRRLTSGGYPGSPTDQPGGVLHLSTGLVDGTSYTYRVRALDHSGNAGAYSTEVSGAPAAAPGQVTGLSVVAQSGPTRITVSWDARPAIEGVSTYRVTRRVGTSETVSEVSGQTSFSDLNATVGTTYFYRVAGRDPAGNYGPDTAEQSATIAQPAGRTYGSGSYGDGTYGDTDPNAPAAPAFPATLVVVPTGVMVFWLPNVEPDLAGYLLERSVDGGSYQQIADTADTFWLDEGMGPVRTVQYRLRAYDLGGNRSPYSPPSVLLNLERYGRLGERRYVRVPALVRTVLAVFKRATVAVARHSTGVRITPRTTGVRVPAQERDVRIPPQDRTVE
jgi:hypothetical protein